MVLSASPTITGTTTFGGINLSAAAWGTAGIGFRQAVTTYTDNSTAAAGTITIAIMNLFGTAAYAATNANVTVSNLYGNYFNVPIASTNVSVTNAYAIYAEGLYVANNTNFTAPGGSADSLISSSQSTGLVTVGSISGTGTITLGRSTVSQTTNIQAGATASGSTKTINIGTAGLSGSTTAIAIGSAISGATQTTTVNGRITLAPIGATVAAWSTGGVGLVQSAATFTDNTTAAAGTVATAYMNLMAPQTYAATNAITVTTLYGTYFQNPVRNSGVSGTTTYALGADSISSAGTTSTSTLTVLTNASIGLSTNTQTFTFGGGATASTFVKTVNLGTGGVSGSTTTINIGSTAAAGVVTINGSIKPLSVTASPAAGTLTPAADTANQFNYTALTGIYVIAAPSGTPADGQVLILRFKDSGVVATFTWNAIYRIVGTTLPTTTVASKTTYVGCKYNSTDTKWDVIAVAQEA